MAYAGADHVRAARREKWPYTVICTQCAPAFLPLPSAAALHIQQHGECSCDAVLPCSAHFDHVAGNHFFEDGEICFGGADPEFCLASIGKPMPLYDGSFMDEVKGFKVTKWLQASLSLHRLPYAGCHVCMQ